MADIFLKPGREKSVLNRHPWIFSGAIEAVQGNPGIGDTVQIRDSSGKALAQAAYSPHSQIRARIWTWNPEEDINPQFFARKLKSAITIREQVVPPQETDALRLVFAESDGIPGFVADRYGEYLVVQFLSAGAEAWREVLVEEIEALTGVQGIYERSDVDVRELEGLAPRAGNLWGDEPPRVINIHENGLHFGVDIHAGHKTGFYLDQRANRNLLKGFSTGKEVLNCFSYTGGFSIYALAGGATSVLSVDTSADALVMGVENLKLNHFPADRASWMEGDVFQVLRKFRDQARSFDVIVLDPPKFAQTAAQAERAARGYKDVNLLAFKLLRPGGILFTFSCSGGVSPDLFQKIVAGAAADAGVETRILYRMSQGTDHPVALNFPEGLYLKGLVVQKQ